MSGAWTNYSVGTASHAGDDDGPVSVGGEDVPACASCKKRKLRCSRELPICSHCVRLCKQIALFMSHSSDRAAASECIYQPKQKPGLKPGAVEALTRRVALLEQILLDDKGAVRPQYNIDDAQPRDRDRGLQDSHRGGAAFQNAATSEATRINEAAQKQHQQERQLHEQRKQSMQEHVAQMRSATSNGQITLKRKFESTTPPDWLNAADTIDIGEHLPSQEVLERIAEFFCISFHHWIPYIHKQRLKTRVKEGRRQCEHDLVLHAIVAVALRHMDPDVIFMDPDEVRRQSGISRMIVETHAMRSVSVESLQALIFLVFDHLNNGEPQRAWPLIGSLTRTIDYLQLTTEPITSHSGSLMTPVRLVRPSSDWTELEERRRLFWVIFLLDRFCSYNTGWNTSLTADDVHRRLPADGGYFTREEPVTTPYFGIWNKAAARIGRSLANVPAQYNEDDVAVDPAQGQGASPNSANGYIDASKLGAFAYCVEATESLSQVTTFFLQQRINWQDKEHAISWLTRFKELDLRLVHWKIFLPTRWKDSNISPDQSIVDMDPNLTLAHITHNTSMILLHHPIAYPPKALWNDYVSLPKDCSAQTCILAAVETSNIVDKFLAHTLIPFVNVQFSFCAYIAAKTLLFEHQAKRQSLRPEFQRLVRDLWDMSARWYGKHNHQNNGATLPKKPQAGLYAEHLERLLEICQQDTEFRFDFYDHSGLSLNPQEALSPGGSLTSCQRTGNIKFDPHRLSGHARQNSLAASHATLSPNQLPSTTVTHATSASAPSYDNNQTRIQSGNLLSPTGIPTSFTGRQAPLSYSNQGQPIYQMGPPGASTAIPSGSHFQSMSGMGNSVQDQSLLNLSDAFMDSHFLDMDRVITFEDANFLLPGDTFRWQ